MRRAFTLVETLVTSGIIALLIAIAIPALASARLSAKLSASESVASQTATILLTHSADHDARLFAGVIDDAASGTYTNWQGEHRMYFETHLTWSADIGEAYVPSGRGGEFDSPFDREQTWGDYPYSCALTTDPAFWNRLTRFGPTQWTPPRLSQATYPNAKVFTYDRLLLEEATDGLYGGRFRDRLLASFLDGSVDRIESASLGYFKGDGLGDWPGAFHGEASTEGLHTVNGIKGRDR